MSLQTIADVFYTAVGRHNERVLLCKQEGIWVPISSTELYQRVTAVARALRSWGLRKGDRVAILGENRFEWTIADLATMLTGAVVVPVYATLLAEQTAWILRNSAARALFLSTSEQLEKFRSIRAQTSIEKIIVMDDIPSLGEVVSMSELMRSPAPAPDPAFDQAARAIGPQDLATIIYTSGTTGNMKGVMLTHGNLASNLECSLEEIPVGVGDRHVSFLPLAHVTARHVDLAALHRGMTIAYCASLEKLPDVLREVRPTLFVAVPRVYEKIKEHAARQAKGVKGRIFNWALKVGRRHREDTLAGKTPASLRWKLADRLVFSKLRQGMGGAARIFAAGGAPLRRDVAEWYAAAGIRIDEGYGLTETSPVISVNTTPAHKLGTVGKPLRNVQIRLADDGEILVRAPSVFSGYWNLPEETRQAFVDGWFKTGDIGEIDSDGFLSITDRKKNLIKTSGGKFIVPQPLEARLKANPLISEAVIVGDGRKFAAVIIVPDLNILQEWAEHNGMVAQPPNILLQDARVRSLYEGIVAQLNQELAQFERLKKLALLPAVFSTADGTLTPSMKLRRKAIEELYRKEIDALYAEEVLALPLGNSR